MRTLLPVGIALAFILGLAGWTVNMAVQKTDEASGKNQTRMTQHDSKSSRKQLEGMPEMREVWKTLKEGQRQQMREFVEKMNRTQESR